MNKRIIYEPAIGETIPDSAVTYVLPVAGVTVIDVIVDEAFSTAGTVYYESLLGIPLAEPKIHDFSGWEI